MKKLGKNPFFFWLLKSLLFSKTDHASWKFEPEKYFELQYLNGLQLEYKFPNQQKNASFLDLNRSEQVQYLNMAYALVALDLP